MQEAGSIRRSWWPERCPRATSLERCPCRPRPHRQRSSSVVTAEDDRRRRSRRAATGAEQPGGAGSAPDCGGHARQPAATSSAGRNSGGDVTGRRRGAGEDFQAASKKTSTDWPAPKHRPGRGCVDGWRRRPSTAKSVRPVCGILLQRAALYAIRPAGRCRLPDRRARSPPDPAPTAKRGRRQLRAAAAPARRGRDGG